MVMEVKGNLEGRAKNNHVVKELVLDTAAIPILDSNRPDRKWMDLGGFSTHSRAMAILVGGKKMGGNACQGGGVRKNGKKLIFTRHYNCLKTQFKNKNLPCFIFHFFLHKSCA